MIYNKKEIITENLSRLAEKQSRLAEKRAAHISDLASYLADEAGEDEIFFKDESFVSLYREAVNGIIPMELKGVLPENAESFKKMLPCLSAYERAVLCKRLTDSLGISGLQASGTYFEDLSYVGSDTICYMKSPYADKAYIKFAEKMKEPRVIYGYDFNEVCENVYNEKAEYCIIPISNTADGRLAGFRKLSSKYSLKTVMTTKISLNSDDNETVFALMGKNITPPMGTGKKYIEIKLNEAEPSYILGAADAFSMKCKGIFSNISESTEYDMIFEVSEEGICGFLSFLLLEFKDAFITGFYEEI